MDKDESDSNDRVSPTDSVKFIIMDSQCESEDPDILQLPALQQPKIKVQGRKGQKSWISVMEDTDSDYKSSKSETRNVNVLVSDSEYDISSKLKEKEASNSSSESINVVGDSEDQMDITVIERKPSEKTETKESDRSDSGSSFASNSRQTLGKYNTAEMSHSQGAKVRGHLFPESIDPSEMDLFEGGENEDIVSTPAEHLGSLQLSAKSMLVPETVEEEIFPLSPSQGSFPHIIPNSPTSDKDETIYDPTAEQTLSAQATPSRNSQKNQKAMETEDYFHLQYSGTETEPSLKKKTQDSFIHDVNKSDDVIVISQDDEEQDMDYGPSQEFALRLSPSQSTQKDSKSTESKSSEGNDSFHIKVPQVTVESKKDMAAQSDLTMTSYKQDEEDMVTQTPQDLLKKDKSIEIISQPLEENLERIQLKPVPSLSLDMITIESQVSEHSFNLNRPEVPAVSSEPSEDLRADVFRKIKSSDKTASRYVIHDDSDEEVSFKPTPSKGEEEKMSDGENKDTRPKLKMSRTMSSEVTSTGYQASVEGSLSSLHQEDIIGVQKPIIDGSHMFTDGKQHMESQGKVPSKTDSLLDLDGTQSYNAENYASTSNKKSLDLSEKQNELQGKEKNISEHEQGTGSPTLSKSKELSQSKIEIGNEDKNKNISSGEISTVDKDLPETPRRTVSQGNPKDKDIERKSSSADAINKDSANRNSRRLIVKKLEGFKEVDTNVKRKGKSKEVLKEQAVSKQDDPYEFHGSQSQMIEEPGASNQGDSHGGMNPLEYYKQRKTPSQIKHKPPPTRKRKRIIHKKTGLKAAQKKNPSIEHHVCFSSPVTESLTTPPDQSHKGQTASSGGGQRSQLNSRDITLVSVPTRVGEEYTFSPPKDRIEEDFPNITRPVTLHSKPIVVSEEQGTSHATEMRPPRSLPPVGKSPVVASPSTRRATPTATPTLERSDTLPRQHTETHKDHAQAGQKNSFRLKVVTTTLVTYKTVETIEKLVHDDGTVQILSQHTEKFPRPVQTKTYTETTEEDFVDSPISPSRTNSSVTTGDLGDISSSLSRSGSNPSSLETQKVGGPDMVVTQQSESTIVTRGSIDTRPTAASPRDTHHISVTETYSPLDVSSIHKTSDRRLSSENLFTSPDTSKGEEDVKKGESSGLSDAITCAQRKIIDPVQRSGEESEPLFVLPKATTTGSSDSNYVSPEIPNQDQVVSTTKPDKSDNQKPIQKDTRIMAKWKDSHYYPGVIKDVIGKSRYSVQFDDGDVLVIKGCDILLIEKLPIGQPVMVLAKDGYFYPGIITEETKKGEVIQYTVDQDNGKIGKFRYSQVILSEDQAVSLIADLHCQLSEPSADFEEVIVKNPDVSLENLVIGKRRKASRYEQQDVSTGSQEDPKPGPSSSKKNKDSESPTPTSIKRRKGPATSTPRFTKRRKFTDDDEINSTPPTHTLASPITPRRSPRKGSTTPKPDKLFKGLYFMLTHAEISPEAIAIEKEILKDSSVETSTDESSQDDVEKIPYDKDFLKKKIRAEGGIMMDRLDKRSKLKSPVFLITDAFHRTLKYFQSLAAGLPCVSHLWIRDCIQQHTLLDYKSYILQAGISFEKKKIVEWNSRRGGLAGMTLMLSSENTKLVDEWSNVAEVAGANVVNKLHNRKDTEDRVQVLVTDSSCKPELIRSATSLRVPLVSTEWIIQCLINGQIMDFTGHPRYQYDFDVM